MRPDFGTFEPRFAVTATACLAAAGLFITSLQAVGPDGRSIAFDPDGRALYEQNCATCHGASGAGDGPGARALPVQPADFSDCNFVTREPDTDFMAVAAEGGPARGFHPIMPAWGDQLGQDELEAVLGYIRTFCADDDWPRGELNFPRPLFTEKAYPEDEAVTTVDYDTEGARSVMNELLYERRFGSRFQVEAALPFGLREGAGDDPAWLGGVGDLAVGAKYALFHSYEAGSIFSLGSEVIVPTGDDDRGFGKGTVIFEPFALFGQSLPFDRSSFVQLQAAAEFPTDADKAEDEALWRAALGRTFRQGRFGRAWTPMVEVMGKRELVSGADVAWDLVPQMQVTLNTRQHVMANLGVLLPLTDSDVRDTRVVLYVLWDWFDGGLTDGW